MSSDSNFDELLSAIERASKINTNAVHESFDKYLMDCDRVIAGQAALQSMRDSNIEIVREILGNPT